MCDCMCCFPCTVCRSVQQRYGTYVCSFVCLPTFRLFLVFSPSRFALLLARPRQLPALPQAEMKRVSLISQQSGAAASSSPFAGPRRRLDKTRHGMQRTAGLGRRQEQQERDGAKEKQADTNERYIDSYQEKLIFYISAYKNGTL